MTRPHRLARVVLLGQLHRGLSILKGEPYYCFVNVKTCVVAPAVTICLNSVVVDE